MINITRRLASFGSLSIKKIDSLGGTGCGLLSSAAFPFSREGGDPKKQRNFVSINSKCKSFSVDGKGDGSQFFLATNRRYFFSKATSVASKNDVLNDGSKQEAQQEQIFSSASPTVITDGESGETYGILLDSRKLPKLKPGVVRKRLENCRTYVGREKSIRQSPWKLNRICQLASGLTLEEALTQLKFCELKNADLVAKVLKRTSNLADIRDGLQMSQLEVKECFATKSLMLRRIKTMGRGR